MVAVFPEWTSALPLAQMGLFRRQVLLPDFATHLQHRTYEDYIAVLANLHDTDAQGVTRFLQERITTLIPGNR